MKIRKRKIRKPRNLQALEMILRSTGSGAAGKHANHDREVQKGWRRHPKHRKCADDKEPQGSVGARLGNTRLNIEHDGGPTTSDRLLPEIRSGLDFWEG
ncbi:MAG: hypothetical protein Q7S02_00905 [bacterium]|nr:hypothetical protein [bacterium]